MNYLSNNKLICFFHSKYIKKIKNYKMAPFEKIKYSQQEPTTDNPKLPIEVKEPIVEETGWSLGNLKWEYEVSHQNIQFESLKESLSEKEEITRLFGVFDEYIDKKLDIFSPIEKENIKLVMWDDFQDLFSVHGSLGVLVDKVTWNVRNALEPLNKVKADEEGNRKIQDILKAGKSILDSFWTDPDTKLSVLDYVDQKLWANINTLLEEKKRNPSPDFWSLSIIQQILGGNINWEFIQAVKTNEEVSKEIQAKTQKIALSFEGKAELGTQLSEVIDNLPVGWDSIKEFISEIVAKYPILGFLISMFMWEGFLDAFVSGEHKERKESFAALIGLSEDSLSPISGIFPEGFEESFDISKLGEFFKYLESNKIDHTKDNFWKELLSGDTENENIKNLSNILKENYGEKILSSKDSENNGKGLIKKLNSLPKIISDTAQAEAEAALDAEGKALFGKSEAIPVSVTTPTEQSWEPLETSEDTPDTTEAQATTWLEEVDVSTEEAAATPDKIRRAREFSHNSVKTSINGATKLPMQINYGGNKWELEKLWIPVIKEIDFQDGKLIVWGNEYEIQFGEFTHNAPIVWDIQIKWLHISGTPKITSSDIVLNCKTEDLWGFIWVKEQNKGLPKEKFSEIILWILKNWNHADTIPASGKTSEISFNVIKTANASSIA